MLVLNDGEPTRHYLASNIYSATDLSLITIDHVNDAHFHIQDDSWGSDYFYIFNTFASNTNSQTKSNKPLLGFFFQMISHNLSLLRLLLLIILENDT